MAKRKEDQPAPGSPAWMATFGDLMNLLLCFFVLLFSMSTIDATKFESIAAALSSSFSILSGGGASVGEGVLISNGVSQLNELSVYITNMGQSQESTEDMEAIDQVEAQKLKQSEEMAEQIEEYLNENDLQESMEIDFTSQYVVLTLNGALLFDSGSAEIRGNSILLVDRVGDMLQFYQDHIIEVEGHTDNVPINNSRYKNNLELSSARAITVVEYFINTKGINPAKLKPSGRGEYVEVADNSTKEGRDRNRRVEIKIYNELSSYE